MVYVFNMLSYKKEIRRRNYVYVVISMNLIKSLEFLI
jgi:hypothetical protein